MNTNLDIEGRATPHYILPKQPHRNVSPWLVPQRVRVQQTSQECLNYRDGHIIGYKHYIHKQDNENSCSRLANSPPKVKEKKKGSLQNGATPNLLALDESLVYNLHLNHYFVKFKTSIQALIPPPPPPPPHVWPHDSL